MKLDLLIAKVHRMAKLVGALDTDERESSKRRRSLVLAREMRKRGWLSEEGYSPDSWAAPRR